MLSGPLKTSRVNRINAFDVAASVRRPNPDRGILDNHPHSPALEMAASTVTFDFTSLNDPQHKFPRPNARAGEPAR